MLAFSSSSGGTFGKNVIDMCLNGRSNPLARLLSSFGMMLGCLLLLFMGMLRPRMSGSLFLVS